MTDQQKREIERQLNILSLSFEQRKECGYSTEIPHEKFVSIANVLCVLGYEVVDDGTRIFSGTHYKRYRIEEMKN